MAASIHWESCLWVLLYKRTSNYLGSLPEPLVLGNSSIISGRRNSLVCGLWLQGSRLLQRPVVTWPSYEILQEPIGNCRNHFLDPKSTQDNGPKPLKGAQKVILFHILSVPRWLMEGYPTPLEVPWPKSSKWQYSPHKARKSWFGKPFKSRLRP